MTKRVSLKGKGADIFFGDYRPSESPASKPEPVPADMPAAAASEQSELTSKQASKNASAHTRTDASIHHDETIEVPSTDAPQDPALASKQASKPARTPHGTTSGAAPAPIPTASPAGGPVDADGLTVAWQHVGQRATVTNAFRYTNRELEWLTDTLYELGKRHHVKLSKQDVARFGLDVVLADHQARGDASLLSELARRRKQQEPAAE